MTLLKHIRTIIFIFTAILTVAVYAYILNTATSARLQTIRLTQVYAILSITYLYFTLLASPLYIVFPTFGLRALHIKARKALGLSAWWFGLLHGCFAFFGQLGGFAGLGFLSTTYLIAITLSATALLILSIMALTSLTTMIRMLGVYWKPLHRLVYIAGLCILIHSLMLGTHFADLSGLIPRTLTIALLLLLLLEAYRVDLYLATSFGARRYIAFTVLTLCITAFASYYFFVLTDINTLLSVHGKHKLPTVPKGRFTLNIQDSGTVLPGKQTTLTFTIVDTQTNQPVQRLLPTFEKLVHMIVVNSELTYFDHIHPQKTASGFSVPITFPKADVYYIYTNYQPLGIAEQTSSAVLPVGTQTRVPSMQRPDTVLTKQFDGYDVTFHSNGPLRADTIAQGKQVFIFTVKRAGTHEPITDIYPYIGAFGHLVMIHQSTYEYVHIHPLRIDPPLPQERTGPDIEFVPISLTTKITPGIYRMFAQLRPEGHLIVADFTIHIQ